MNAEVKSALSAQDDVVVVTASAGSGKTQLIINKVAKIISEGAAPAQIRVVTYTNAAADEMRERLVALVGEPSLEGIFIGTLNSYALKAVREAADTPKFSAFNRRGWLSSEPSLWRLVDDPAVDQIIREVRDTLGKKVTLKALKLGLSSDLNAPKKLNDKGSLARSALRTANYITQDDLVEMLSDGAHTLGDQIKHLIVDEGQDLPHSHRRFVAEVIKLGAKVFICQDDAQSIFGFLSEHQLKCGISEQEKIDGAPYTLSTNYRSGRKIVELANRVRLRLAQDGACSNLQQEAFRDTDGEVVGVAFKMLCNDKYEESVPQDILNSIAFEFAASESCALLCRTWAEVNMFRPFLLERGLCEAADSSLSLKLPQNRALLSLAEILSRRSMSIDDLEGLASYQTFAPLGSVIERTASAAELALAVYRADRSSTLASIVDDFIGESLWATLDVGSSIDALTELWVDIGGGHSPLLAKAGDFSDVADLCAQAQRLSKSNVSANKIVTTTHQAKGLEYDTVIIYGVSEGVYPSRRDKTPELVNEAGRCLYTSITRARDRLIMLRPTEVRGKERARSPWLD